MSTSIHTNVSVYRRGRLQQGYSLEGDKTKVVLRSRGFSITLEMQDNANEDRPQASIKVCGHEIFNTEDHTLKAPEIVVIDSLTALGEEVHAGVPTKAAAPFGKLENFVPHAILVALDNQTQSVQKE